MFKSTVSIIAITTLLTACQTVPDTDDQDLCGASGYQSFLGTNVAAINLPAGLNHRIIGPGDGYTRDYIRERLNIFTDENGDIIEVRCG